MAGHNVSDGAASSDSGLRIGDDRLRAEDARPSSDLDRVVDTGESRGNIAFSIALWLAGKRFGAGSKAHDAALAHGWSVAEVKSGSLANDIDKALGPAFEDGGVAVDCYVCFDSSISGPIPAVHPWNTYRRTAFDDYFKALTSRLGKQSAQTLIDRLGGAIPENAGFNGMKGFPFAGIKTSCLNEPGRKGSRIRFGANTMLSGIGPHGELLPQFRRVGSMKFDDEECYVDFWPFSLPGAAHPTEAKLWDRKLKDSLLDADVDKPCRGAGDQLVHRTQPGRLMDYLVCLPYTAAWKLAHDAAQPMGSAQAAAELKRMFLYAYQDSDNAAFTEEQRTFLDRQPWPASAGNVAALIAAALIDYALGKGSLFGTVMRMLRRELSQQAAYLERLQDWACEITERDGASSKAERLQDVYVAPLFSDTNAVAWLLDPDAPRRLLLQAGSGMGKSTFLHAAAAACASARLARISQALDNGEGDGEDAVQFSEAFARSDSPDALAPDQALDRLSGYLPVVLSQTRNEAVYRRLEDPNDPATFSDLAFEALSETMRDALRSAASEEDDAANPIDALVERGGVLLMVDSIDEIPRRHRAAYLRSLRAFADQDGIARLLIASRPLPPADDAALRSLLGKGACRARLEEFDLPRQENLFGRVATRGGADAYDGPSFSQVRATAGFRDVMGNPFMLTAIALAFKRARTRDRLSVWGTFTEINKKFRKRTTLGEYDSRALEHLAFDLTAGSPTLPSSEFVERFRAYRNAEASHQARSSVTLELDEDELMDLIMSRLGIIDVCDDEIGFPYAAVCGFWASLWVRHCVEQAQELPLSMMDMRGMGKGEREERFERAGNAGAEQLRLLLGADAGRGRGADGSRNEAALLAVLFTLDYAGSPSHPDYPAFDVLGDIAYRRLLSDCVLGTDSQAQEAERALREASVFAFGKPLAGYTEKAGPYLGRLSAFAQKE